MRALTTTLVTSAALFANEALACPACAVSKEQSQAAFIGTTALLTFLPLIVVGGVAFWLIKQARAADAAEQQAVPDAG